MRQIAAAVSLPYEIVSGDLSATTYAAGRHSITLRPFGTGSPRRSTVNIRPGQMERLGVRLGS